MFRRAEVYGTRKRVVDYRDQSVMLREVHDSLKIRHLHEGVRDRLDIDRFRVRPDFLLPRLLVVSVDESVRNSELFQVSRNKIVCPTVETVLSKEMIAC